MSEPRFTISLRIWHPTHASEPIIKVIGLPPSRAWSVGKPRTTPKGQALEGIYQETYCCFSLKEQISGYFVDGVRELLSTLAKFQDYLKEIRDGGGRAELYVGVFVEGSSGFTLSTTDMAKLAAMSLDLSVEYYF